MIKILYALRWLLVAVIVITITTKTAMLRMLAAWNLDIRGSALVLVFFIGSIGAIFGLILKRLWGFVSLYALMPVSTYLGISIIPVARLFPVYLRTNMVILLNIVTLGATILLQINRDKIKS